MASLQRIGTYPIEYVEDLIRNDISNWDGIPFKGQKSGEHNIVVDGYNVYTLSLRYKTFMEKGHVCKRCMRKGSYYALETSNPASKRAHFNLYADDGMLMTKDHIFPKSKGGIDSIDNMETLCQECNSKKGNTVNESQKHQTG